MSNRFFSGKVLVTGARGVYFARQGRGLLMALGRVFLRAQPYYLIGHIFGSRRRFVD